MSTRAEDLIKRFRGTIEEDTAPATTTSRLEQIERRVAARAAEIRNSILEIDPNFDQERGVEDFTFRADFSRMDSPEERETYLARQVGPQGYTQDRYGKYALTPTGMDALGLEHSDKPVYLDEPKLTAFDIADLRGDLPAIGGATALGIATGGSGILGGIAAAALGGAGGKAIDEAADAIRGDNLQGPGDIAKDLAKEAAFAAGGEAFTRGVMLPIGRKLLAPEAKRMTPEAIELAEDAFAIGAKPNVSQLTRAPILGRAQSMMNRVLGDPLAAKNSAALGREIRRLAEQAGDKIAKNTDLGELIASNIKQARTQFSNESGAMYQLFDDVVGGRPIVPTTRLRAAAQELLDEMPKTAQGRSVLTPPDTIRELSLIADLPDFITGKQMQIMRGALWNASRVNNLVPGLSSRQANILRRAASKSFGDVTDLTTPELLTRHFDLDLGNEEAQQAFLEGGYEQVMKNAVESLKRADAFYSKGIKEFDNNIISRITRDPSMASSLDPETVVDTVFRKGRTTNLKRVMGVLPERTKRKVRRTAMEDILNNVRDDVSDPLVAVFNGPKLARTLESYGDETLEAMFGAQRTEELKRFARVTSVITQRQAMSGGLVAAHVALHPLRNMTRLAGMRVLSWAMNTDNGLRWLTTGIEAPKTRAGAAALSRFGAQLAALRDEEMADEVQ